MTKQEIGLFVLKERNDQKLSQQQLADKAGLNRRQQIMEIETNAVDYGVEVLVKVLKALGYILVPLNPGSPGDLKPVDTELFYKEPTQVLFDFSKVESIKPEPIEEKVGKLTKKTVSLPFKRKKQKS